MRTVLRFVVLLLVALLPWRALAQDIKYVSATGTISFPPYGYISFCLRFPSECSLDGLGVRVPTLTKSLRNELAVVNSNVNNAVTPITDWEHYNHTVVDWWDFPTDGKGDCEDYVLQKRRNLHQLGWPISSLLITVVSDETKQGHAVLMVHTDSGDLILDNRYPRVRLWSETPYHFVMRQSAQNPNVWITLDDHHTVITSAPR